MQDGIVEQIADQAATILAYHRRTEHTRERYAAGPETLDWDEQPSPWRRFTGCAATHLPLVSDRLDAPYAAVTGQATVALAPFDRPAVGAVLELAFGLSAIKQWGPDRWALRCNPSSGNLHPTEVYVIAGGLDGLANGVHHYLPEVHALERRCAVDLAGAGLWIGLSSIHWREAWKYGERALRYCQLDVGHALGALAAAAAILGWEARIVPDLQAPRLAGLLGLDREADFAAGEREEAEVLVQLVPRGQAEVAPPVPEGAGTWAGIANRLDPRPMYDWSVIEEAARACEGAAAAIDLAGRVPDLPAPTVRAADVVLSRRSAQRYDRGAAMARDTFARLLAAAGAIGGPQLVAFVHNVEGLSPGLYRLESGLSQLISGDLRREARAICCHQAIAADAAVTFAMLSAFAEPIAAEPAAWRHCHWQAGLIGHRLYLEATSLGLAGTGIGCFLDPEIHALLGIADDRLRVLYGFAVGQPIIDPRISSLPPYPGRTRSEG